jgi:hypothetical protein
MRGTPMRGTLMRAGQRGLYVMKLVSFKRSDEEDYEGLAVTISASVLSVGLEWSLLRAAGMGRNMQVDVSR